MKKYCILSLLLMILFVTPKAFSQSYRLTKVGIIDLERVIREVTNDPEIKEGLQKKLEEYKQRASQEENNNTADTSLASASKDYSLRGEVKRQVAAAISAIVKKEGYTLILEKTEHSIIFADRSFDITEPVIASIKKTLLKE